MSVVNGRGVKFARLYEVTHINGIGQIGPVMEPCAAKMHGTLRLTLCEPFMRVELEAKHIDVLIPLTCFKTIELLPAVPKAEKNETKASR